MPRMYSISTFPTLECFPGLKGKVGGLVVGVVVYALNTHMTPIPCLQYQTVGVPEACALKSEQLAEGEEDDERTRTLVSPRIGPLPAEVVLANSLILTGSGGIPLTTLARYPRT